MATSKRATAKVSKIRKGSYKVTLPKRLPKAKQPKMVAPVVIDAIPIPVAGYACVRADGTIDPTKSSRNLRVSRISYGHYQVEFVTQQVVTSVIVQPDRKPRSRHVVARVCRLARRNPSLNPVEIHLNTLNGSCVDLPFAIMGITDGTKVPKVAMEPSRDDTPNDDMWP